MMIRTALGGAYTGVVVSQDATGLHLRLTGTSEIVRVAWVHVDPMPAKVKNTHGRGVAKPVKAKRVTVRAANTSPKASPKRELVGRERELTDAQRHAGMPSIGM